VATGIVFAPTDALGLALALHRLTALYADRKTWDRLQRNAMKHPVGWAASAAAYARLYDGLAG
jgi:starch synthase